MPNCLAFITMKEVKQKLSSFFPSSFTSCQFLRLLSDVSERSVSNKTPHNNKNFHSFRANHRRTFPVSGGDRHVNRCYSLDSGWFTSPNAGSEGLRSFSSISFDSIVSRRIGTLPDEIAAVSFDSVISRCQARKSPAAAPKIAPGETKKKPLRNNGGIRNELGWDTSLTRAYYKGKRTSRVRSRRRRNTRWVMDYRWVIGDTCAVSKKSDDPRGDFRESMMEMIIEKEMFVEGDLKKLLLCFLHLNHVSYHGIIYDVFHEICETLHIK